MTNAKFAKTDRLFKFSCEAAGIPATRRQASKFRLKKGLAYQNRMTLKEMQDERAKHKRLSENYIYWTRQIERLVFANY